MKKRKSKKKPSHKILEATLEGLKEIEAHFEMEGFGEPEPAPAGGEDRDENEEDDDNEESDLSSPSTFDREDIEIAIDLFISHLVTEKIIPTQEKRSRHALSEVFGHLFGEGHDITVKVSSFEKNIKGYFDLVEYDDMQTAYFELLEVRDMIQKLARTKEKADAAN